MEQDFYKGRLAKKYGLEVVVPEAQDRKIVNDIIYDELCLGQINQKSNGEYIIVVLSKSAYPPGAEERIAEISRAVYEYFIRQ